MPFKCLANAPVSKSFMLGALFYVWHAQQTQTFLSGLLQTKLFEFDKFMQVNVNWNEVIKTGKTLPYCVLFISRRKLDSWLNTLPNVRLAFHLV
jgi:hypothetical protein